MVLTQLRLYVETISSAIISFHTTMVLTQRLYLRRKGR